MKITLTVLVGCFGLGIVAPAAAKEAVDECVQAELDKGMFLGAVVAVGTPDETLFLKAYGQRDVGSPMTTDCLFDVASVTKVTTVATGLAITLQRHPEMSLDDRVQEYLPGMTGRGAERVTIRHLATHRSGLDNTKQLHPKFAGDALVEQIIARDHAWPVDSRYEYSCLGMIRLSEMIATVNQSEFGAFCRQNIFAPLEMTDTYFSPVPEPLRPRVVATTGPRGVVEDHNARRIGRPVGNAGVFTTARDLGRLASLWLRKGRCDRGQLFSLAIADAMTRGAIVWQVENEGQLPANVSPGTFFHTGHTGQTLIVDPKRNAYILVLTAWSHPAVKAGYQESRKARARIAGTVIEELLDR